MATTQTTALMAGAASGALASGVNKDNEAPATTVAKKQVLPEPWTKEHIIAQQDAIKKTLVGLDGDVHTLMVQLLMHVKKHRDTSLVRRFLVDIITAETGYRRAAIIAWFRNYSPMELAGDNVNLSGKDPETGKERPFRILEAMANPFRTDNRFKEVIQPFFTDNLRSGLAAQVKRAKAALANVGKDGQPIDPEKPFFDGIKADQVAAALAQIEVALSALPIDDTKAKRKVEQEAKLHGLKLIDGDKVAKAA